MFNVACVSAYLLIVFTCMMTGSDSGNIITYYKHSGMSTDIMLYVYAVAGVI